MKFSVLTLFPDLIQHFCRTSIIGRSLEKNFFDLDIVNIRNFASGNYAKVDDTLYAGGKGMLMMCDPIWRALESIDGFKNFDKKIKKIYLSPKGKVLNQDMVKKFAKEEHLILLCGHYEGIDSRLLEKADFEEISVGDYVLTGGELPALILIDSVVRMLDHVLAPEAYQSESHFSGLLEEKHYTKPALWQNLTVPEILQRGNHKHISHYKKMSSLSETFHKRPDLLRNIYIDEENWLDLIKFMEINDI